MIAFEDVEVGQKFHLNVMSSAGRVTIYTKLDDKFAEDFWNERKEFAPETEVLVLK